MTITELVYVIEVNLEHIFETPLSVEQNALMISQTKILIFTDEFL